MLLALLLAAIAFDGTAHPGGIALKTQSSTGAASIVSPTFSTAGATVLVVAYSDPSGAASTLSISTTGTNMPAGGTWTKAGQTNSSGNTTHSAIWYVSAASAITSGTVTIGTTVNGTAGLSLYALTGVNATPAGTIAGQNNTGSSTTRVSVTPTVAGSWVILSAADFVSGVARTFAPVGVVTDSDYTDGVGDRIWQLHYVTPDLTAVSIGSSAPTSTDWAGEAMEIVPSGGAAAAVPTRSLLGVGQ